jgi:hypothetical protein
MFVVLCVRWGYAWFATEPGCERASLAGRYLL